MKECDSQEVVRTISLQGKIDTSNSKQLRQDLIAHMDGDITTLVFDLHQVTFIDSSGLGSLVFLLKRMRSQGGRIIFYRPNQQVKMLLDIANMAQLFPICSTEAELAQANINLNSSENVSHRIN
jgi:anti-sigma B factor antagonist